MKWQSWKWGLICLLFVAGAWLLWHQKSGRDGSPSRPHPAVASRPAPTVPAASPHGVINTNATQISLADWNTNKFAGRLSNTPKPIGDLVNDNHAILLENALIDTQLPRNFVFPKNLQPQGDPGAYIVQARGPIDNAFRAMLAQAGATIVSYIPNDAYLVRATASVAGALGGNPRTQAVIPYEPYYKIQSSLLYPAVQQLQQPDRAMLKLGLFADDTTATIQQIEQLGGQIVGRDRSPFGPVVRVIPPRNWTALATLSGVQIMEPYHPRAVANDLARATVGVAADSLTPNNYTNLTGKNIIVEVNDTGIDALHPDLAAGGNYGKAFGVIGDAPQSLVDTNGHGTHVAGIIAGDGASSTTVTNAPGSILNSGKGTNYQFRGMAPGATLFSVGGIQGGADTNIISDMYFQEVPAMTNALISNNSWVFEGDSAYDLSAASYDAAVRDALPFVTGSQPVLFVFAAGNAGNGSDSEDLGGGIADSIESPATGKNVITVGALQEARNITNVVTTVTANADGSLATNTSQPWLPETSTSYRVAGFSSRGNVGVGTEGAFGRYKPDVCAPGTFILSTRSEQWDINSYFYQNPTNHQLKVFSGFIVQPGKIVSRPFPFVPSNAVQLVIETFPNGNSPFSFAVLPTLIGLFTSPGYQYLTANDPVLIPPDPNAPTIQQILASGQGFTGAFNFALSNNTSSQVIFDLLTDIITTNGSGDYFLVLSNLDNSIGTANGASTGPGPFYRYETGTSMATPVVSGTLALMQEFYEKTFIAQPSPAMLKAMLINGAQATGLYTYQVQNTLNYEGWGLINLPNSLPPGIKNQLSTLCSTYVQDQNPDNALATGDSQTFHISVTSTNLQPLRVTLAWTDPPGDPAAAIKLVNNLVLVVTNLSNPTNPIVYYGNDIAASSTFNNPRPTNTPTAFDSINNVQTVNLPLGAGTSFTVTVMGFRVNVNAVTAQSNNVVQDYALVVSCGNGQDPAAMTVTPNSPAPVSNLTGDQQIDFLSGTNVNAALINEFVGANTPLLGNNTVPIGTITVLDTNGLPVPGFSFASNAVVTVGMTNQWHFYVITNSFFATNNAFTNAAFVVFNPNAPDPDTLSIPRMGVFTPPVGNATRDADIDLYVSTQPGLTNLDPNVISNCVHGTQVGLSLGNPFNGASLGPGSSEFVVDIGSQGNEVYYVGVKSEDQMAAEYGFISIFSATPFSTMNNGNQVVNGVPLPVNIPDGSPTVPGKSFVFGLAIYPITVGTVTVSDSITHQNFGDLIGTLTLNGGHPDVLNNHDSFGNLPNTTPPNTYDLLYDDSPGGATAGSRPSDGPGSLVGYFGQQGIGVWQLSEVDDSSSQIGTVNKYQLIIQPRQDLNGAIEAFSIPPGGWFYGFVDVPPGATNLTVTVTNVTPAVNPPLELFVKLGSLPTTNSFDGMTLINIPGPGGLWGFVSLGPPLTSGQYFVGIFNPSSSTVSGQVFATVGLPFVPAQTIYSSTDTPIPILDDAVTTDSINVPDSQTISSLDVAISVRHPRISDLVFHLISPDGTRELLMENRGGTDPNGAGGTATVTTNTVLTSDFDQVPAGDYSGGVVGGWLVTANQVSIQTDPANTPLASNLTNLLALANGTLFTALNTVPGETYTLTFRCRGPGAVSLWRGEGNTSDTLDGNTGNWVGFGTLNNYAAGQVGQTFVFDGTHRDRVDLGNPANLQLQNLTIDAWVKRTSASVISLDENFQDGSIAGPGGYVVGYGAGGYALVILDTGEVALTQNSVNDTQVPPAVTDTSWHHVAVTKTGGNVLFFVDGVPQPPPSLDPYTNVFQFTSSTCIGSRGDAGGNTFYGSIDEPTVYTRSLSASEIKAIYNLGLGGNPKYDPIAPNNAQGLAEAQLSINGTVVSNFFGRNIVWQTKTISFTATQTSTPLQFTGIEPGMLLDAMSVVSVQTNYNYLVFTENTNLTTTPIKFAAPPYNIPSSSGYVQWPLSIGGNGHWYKAVTNSIASPLDWIQADQIAHNEGGYLATITSQAENDFVFGLIDFPQFFEGVGNNGSGPALGGFCTNSAQLPIAWGWETGEPWNYTDWYPGQPDFQSETNLQYFSGINGITAETWNNLGPTDQNLGGYVIERDSLPVGLDYLPEQSLDDAFDGRNALGTWTLEIQDDRVGATNPAPLLLSWQLRFTYVTTGSNSAGIPPGTTATNVTPAGGWTYYPVNVPVSADWATNILVFATGPLDMWFNPTNNPVGTTPPDSELLAASTGGSSTFSLTSSPTNIVPGTTYFIGLFNPNAFPVTNGFQVDFHLIPPPISLTNGVPITNTIPAKVAFSLSGHSSISYAVTVPPNADFATNTLIFATLPVNLWFNQNGPPNGTNPPNYQLLTNSTGGVSILSATSLPQLAPGLTYYLAIENTNGVPVTIALQVDFHFRNPITGPGITTTNINGTNGFLVRWSGPTNYQYFIQWKTNLAPVFPWNTVSNPVINVTFNPPNGNYSWFDDGSLTGGWSPQKFYRILANFISTPTTNGAPVTNVVVAGTIAPFAVAVPANAIAATNVLVSATGPVNVYFNQTGPPTGNTNAGDVLMLSTTTGGTFVLDGSSTPPLVPGANYYLGVQSLGTSNVSFVFQVDFAYGAAPVTNPPSFSGISVTNINGTNAILLKWIAPTNYQFQIQWETNLAPAPAWHTISNVVLTWSGVVSPTNAAYGIFQFLDDGSLTGGLGPWKFYRLIEYPYSTPIPQTLTIINSAIVGNAVRFQWVAPTNYQYSVLWTTNLGMPLGSWSVLANPVLGLSNGVYTFTDTNQTGPLTNPKFFRILEH